MAKEKVSTFKTLITPRYKKIKNIFSAKYKKHESWMQSLEIKDITSGCVLEKGVDEIIKHDGTTEQKNYFIIKVFM